LAPTPLIAFAARHYKQRGSSAEVLRFLGSRHTVPDLVGAPAGDEELVSLVVPLTWREALEPLHPERPGAEEVELPPELSGRGIYEDVHGDGSDEFDSDDDFEDLFGRDIL
jgi:hypothetical protein